MFPVLTPLAVDPAHPFPYISDLSLNLAVVVRDPETGVRRFARVKVPPLLPRFLEALRRPAVRAARAGDRRPPRPALPGDEDRRAPPVPRHARRRRRGRGRRGRRPAGDARVAAPRPAARAGGRSARGHDVDAAAAPDDRCSASCGLTASDLYVIDGLLDLGDLWSLTELQAPRRPKCAPWSGVTPPELARAARAARHLRGASRARRARPSPVRPFATSVEAFVDQAADDPRRARDQADDLPHVRRGRGADRPLARPRSRVRQGGRRPRRAHRARRRGGEHRLGADAREGRRARRLRRRRAEDARQDGARRPQRERHDPPLLPRRHRATTTRRPRRATRTSGCSRATRARPRDVADLFNRLTGYSNGDGYRQDPRRPGNAPRRGSSS